MAAVTAAGVPALFQSLKIRGLTLKNRIVMSPMCQYSAADGAPNDWHATHLVSRAVGGVGLIITEATAVAPEGRISPGCTGIWSDELRKAWAPIVASVKAAGAAVGIQLAHAGRKASTVVPWDARAGSKDQLELDDGGWETVAPSAIPFLPTERPPREATLDDIRRIVSDFAAAAVRADAAGFDVVEIHAAHGYLLHEFLSPLSNKRVDDYGGSLDNRLRLVVQVAEAVRAVWPSEKPLFVRISATDWVEGGWDVQQSTILARRLRDCGVDLIDTSSGAIVPGVRYPVAPGYQVPFAREIRAAAGIATGAVGTITTGHQANGILTDGSADLVFLARALLANPHWPLFAAHELGYKVEWPQQYARARGVLPLMHATGITASDATATAGTRR